MDTLFRKPYLLCFSCVIVMTAAFSGQYTMNKAEAVPPWVESRWQELTTCPHPHYPAPTESFRKAYLNKSLYGYTLQLTKSEVALLACLLLTCTFIFYLLLKP